MHTHTHSHTHTQACMYTHIQVHTLTYVYTYNVHTHIYTLTCTHKYTCMHVHTHILMVHHLHQPQFTEGTLSIRLILKWLHELLDGYPLTCLCVESGANVRVVVVERFGKEVTTFTMQDFPVIVPVVQPWQLSPCN